MIPAFLIFGFVLATSIMLIPIFMVEDMKIELCSIIFFNVFLFSWWVFSTQYPKEIKQETIYPIQEVEYDKGKIQIIIKNDQILPLSNHFKSYLDAEKFDVKVIEYESSYAGLSYLIIDSYEVVEKE